MKKVSILGLFLGVAVMAQGGLPALNATIAKLLAPHNTPNSVAKLVVTKAEVSEKRVEAFGANGYVAVKGDTGNTVAVYLNKGEYSFVGADKVPTTHVILGVRIPFVKLWGQKFLNQVGEELDEVIKGFAIEYAREYGEAFTIQGSQKNKKYDSDGNLIATQFDLNFAIDLSKLPAKVEPKDVLTVKGQIFGSIDLNSMSLDFKVVSNPNAREFQQGQSGLKEYVDGLLNQDPKRLQEVQGDVKTILNFIKKLSESQPEL